MPIPNAASAAPTSAGLWPSLLNFVAFQVGWFACVLGAAYGYPWSGIAVAGAIILWHLWRVVSREPELKLIGVAVLTGVVLDGLLNNLGLIHYFSSAPLQHVAPPWILTLWALFATTLNVSLRWLHSRPWLGAALGAVGAPLSYMSGARLGALALVARTQALTVLAVSWAIITPALVALTKRWDGTRAS